MSLRAAAGGEAIPFTTVGDCFRGSATPQRHPSVALENAVFGACRLSAALGAAQGNHRKHKRLRGRGKAAPCPILRANARHVSLRAAAGGEAIPFSAAGDCFGVALESRSSRRRATSQAVGAVSTAAEAVTTCHR